MSLPPLPQNLTPLDVSAHEFIIPRKEIHTATDVAHFLTSPAYKRITAFINHLNASVSPLATTELQTQQQSSSPPNEGFIKPAVSPERFATNSPNITVSPEVQGIIDLVKELESYVGLCPPEKGPRRFGNVAFRTWHKMVEEKLNEVLDKYVPKKVLATLPQSGKVSARDELAPYLLGSFGSAQRLDYGTGHELSFLAFLCGLYVLNGFEPGRDEPALALRCVDAYLHLIRTLVKTYTLEPAGSHGVWGLDDHTFIPYIFGSSQLTTHAPVSGIVGESVEGVPAPGDITKANIVEQQRDRNLYFGAVGFIYDVKRGPFWEHSPILYDVSGVKEGWGKINIGMLKMYNAEVLGKFPVVQHFPFGSIFNWGSTSRLSSAPPVGAESTSVPISLVHSDNFSDTRPPWAKPGTLPPLNSAPIPPPLVGSRDPMMSDSQQQQQQQPEPPLPELNGPADTRAPWANTARRGPPPATPGSASDMGIVTKAPWAR